METPAARAVRQSMAESPTRSVWPAGRTAAARCRSPAGERRERVGHAGIGARVYEQPAVVDGEIALERVGRRDQPRGREGARHEGRRPVADHAADCLFGERRAAARCEQLVRRVGDVAPRVDQRAVKIEYEQLVAHAEKRSTAKAAKTAKTGTLMTRRPAAFNARSR